MKNLIGALLLVITAQASAQSDFSVTWDITGLDVFGEIGDSITLDLDVGTRYISAHGVLTYTDNLSTNITGTCFISVSDDIFCNLTLASLNIVIDVGGAAVGGLIKVFDERGNLVDTGTLELDDVR